MSFFIYVDLTKEMGINYVFLQQTASNKVLKDTISDWFFAQFLMCRQRWFIPSAKCLFMLE